MDGALIGFLMIFIVGSLSLVGLFMISMKERTLDNILIILVAFGTGTILATALFGLIPEALHHLEELKAEGRPVNENSLFLIVIIGFIVFFILERFIYWFHGHAHETENQFVCYNDKSGALGDQVAEKGKIKSYAILNLFGDGMHNFLDGVIIMVGFLGDFTTGIIITLAVIFHELPQEVGDFGILIYGGFTKKRALLFNFLSAMVAMLGGLVALLISTTTEEFNFFILAFSGGGFLYLASTELMPELIKEKDLKKSVIQTIIFLCGLLLIILLLVLLPHE